MRGRMRQSERLQVTRQAAMTTNVAREAALAFMDADKNGDGVLDWDEVRFGNDGAVG